MRKRFALITCVVVTGLALGACGGDDDPALDSAEDTSSSVAEEPAAGDANDADVAFAQQMIPHHEQAIEMARLADGRADSQEVLDLAARIEGAQQPEIDEMTSWLEAWGEEVEASGMHHDSMSGAMSEEDMTRLEEASGPEFDRLFLEMMIEHHRGAIEMAETEVADGANADAVALARKIIEDQENEIAEMEGLLEELD